MKVHRKEEEVIKKVMFIITTDGLENASREYTKDKIKKMIEKHTNWEFIYIGADIDSYSEAGHIGIKRTHTANYRKSREGFNDVFLSAEFAADEMRCGHRLEEVNWKNRPEKYDD